MKYVALMSRKPLGCCWLWILCWEGEGGVCYVFKAGFRNAVCCGPQGSCTKLIVGELLCAAKLVGKKRSFDGPKPSTFTPAALTVSVVFYVFP